MHHSCQAKETMRIFENFCMMAGLLSCEKMSPASTNLRGGARQQRTWMVTASFCSRIRPREVLCMEQSMVTYFYCFSVTANVFAI